MSIVKIFYIFQKMEYWRSWKLNFEEYLFKIVNIANVKFGGKKEIGKIQILKLNDKWNSKEK